MKSLGLRWRRAICLLCVCLFLLHAVACAPQSEWDESKVQIVTTIFPQYDFARHIAGERAQCHMLMGLGTSDSHAWEPTAGQFEAVSRADLFVCVGGESEAWVDDTLVACGVTEERVLRMLPLVEGLTEEHHHDHTHDEAALDEHVWTDPDNAIILAHAIADTLCRIDPAGTEYYRQNEAIYVAELTALSAEYHTAFDGAAHKTIVVADKFPFRYLAHAYDMTYYAAFPGCASDTEPSLQTIHELICTVETTGIDVVFYVAYSSEKTADTVCESTGAKKRMLHACHTISEAELAEGETYVSLMRQNLAVLKEALGI